MSRNILNMGKRITQVEFIQKSSKLHNNKYNYSFVKYKGSTIPVKIVCPIHGSFLQRPYYHLSGCGCKKCADQFTRGGKQKNNTKFFIKKARKVHKNRYDYSLVEYIHSHQKVKIVCSKHGVFEQRAGEHLYGRGCRQCAHENKQQDYLMSTSYFIARAKNVHGNRYNYSKSEYVGFDIPIVIICKKHGEFKQLPVNHYAGSGCPKCSKCSVSTAETQWLNMLKVKERQVRLFEKDSKFIVDGFDSSTNTVYEFWGDFWHGNPLRYNKDDVNPVNNKTFGQLFEETLQKRKRILDHGFTLVEIWESDWNILQSKI